MRRAALLAALAAAACSRQPRRPFPIGFLEPVSPRVAAEARRLGLEVAAREPAGAAEVTAAAVSGDGEVAADRARLRFLAARAIADGAQGIFLRLPGVPEKLDLLDYVEEWQAVDRVARELLALRPMLEGGVPAAVPFPVAPGLESRAWTFAGRRYVVLVNPAAAPLPLEARRLAPWRALFAVRSDPRQLLPSCGGDLCLEPGGVLWLEGRLLPDVLP